jgi:DNA-binding response OmpR family regulator
VSRQVLLIEDEPNIIEAITFLLKHDGWDVISHSDGGSAIEMIGKTNPDLVILDVMLPNRSGIEILEDLRATEKTKALPVLMLTAKGQAKDRAAADVAGADIYMTKPFSNQEMLKAVRQLVGG